MSIQTTGKLFNEFYNDNDFWPEDSFLDDYYIKVNGEDLTMDLNGDFKDADEIIIESGTVVLPAGDKQLDVYFNEWINLKHPDEFSGAELDVMFRLVKFGPCEAGDLPSKMGFVYLAEKGLAYHICGPLGESMYAGAPALKDKFIKHFGQERLTSSKS